MQGAPEVAKIDRKGVLPEQIYLDYSQERLAAYGYTPSNLKDILGARNITLPGGQLEVGPQSILIDPSGKFTRPAANRRRDHRLFASRRRRVRSICAIWWTFPAATKARRNI